MKIWEVWMEGYVATGNNAGASLYGTATAETFEEACDKVGKGDSYYDPKRRTYWGCKLFPTHAQAAVTFGPGEVSWR